MRRLRLLRWTPVLLVGLLALPLSAGARPGAASANVVIKVGDAVAVAGTHIGCYGVTGDGKDGIVCFKVDAKGLAPGTFGIGAAEGGEVTAYKIKANREPKRIFKRTLQAAAAPAVAGKATKTITLGVGKVFGLAKTDILCQILKITKGVAPLYRGVKVGCFRADTSGVLPSTYGVVLSDKFAAVFRFDAQGNAGPSLFERKQP